MATTSAAYGSMGLVPTLVAERAVFLRERADGLYLPITYLASLHMQRACLPAWEARPCVQALPFTAAVSLACWHARVSPFPLPPYIGGQPLPDRKSVV